jgi:hypothetical protein
MSCFARHGEVRQIGVAREDIATSRVVVLGAVNLLVVVRDLVATMPLFLESTSSTLLSRLVAPAASAVFRATLVITHRGRRYHMGTISSRRLRLSGETKARAFCVESDIFLKSQYVVFDAEGPRLGFAAQA